MTTSHLRASICLATLCFCAANASAAVIFSDSFGAGSAASWTTNAAPTANAANQDAVFGFDYSAFGIPAAPGGSDTIGLRLRANIPGGAASPVTTRPAGTISGLSVSPTGQNFGPNYLVSFYAWANFNGSANAQGLADNANSEGGTNNVMFALGTSGTVPVVVGNTTLVTNGVMDGIGFATSGDGGIANDYRVYPKSGTIVPAGPTYAAGALANSNAYYTNLFPPVSAPAIQQALSTAEYGGDAANTQAGLTQAGAFGFAWHKVEISINNGIAKWKIDGAPIATYDASALTLGGSNIALGVSDVNTTTTRHPSLLFTVFDNLEVSSVPEPSAMLLLVLGIGCCWQGRRRK